MIAYIKTHFIRIIQRKWKYIFKKRKNILKNHANPKSLKYRETYGKWPKLFVS